ncbi:MAG TPA: hypothetical protein VK465_14505 [Fibrobacteria bacterium]|nr:hypothetical protein [Fibrobacteria bacterium]
MQDLKQDIRLLLALITVCELRQEIRTLRARLTESQSTAPN